MFPMRQLNVIGLTMLHHMLIKIGTIGVQSNDENLLIVTKIEGHLIYCHRFRGNKKTIKLPLNQFKPLIY
jgi:hypothetical protein